MEGETRARKFDLRANEAVKIGMLAMRLTMCEIDLQTSGKRRANRPLHTTGTH